MSGIDGARDSFGGCLAIRGKATGFFHLEEIEGRWWLVTPEGNGFISIGMNHLDPASWKCPENLHIFHERYGGSNERLIAEGMAKPLREWGFNTIGWAQELVGGKWKDPSMPIFHSPEWPHAWYQTAAMPYMYNFVFAQIEVFQLQPFYPDVFSPLFEEWVDYQARAVCADMAKEPLLIGYADMPVPGFTVKCPGSWAENLNLDDPADLAKLKKIVRRYFELTTASIRRYDPNHLILGPRFSGVPDTPEWLIELAGEFFDALLCNWFVPIEKVASELSEWNRISGRPVFLADMAFLAPTERLKMGPGGPNYAPDQKTRGEAYARYCEQALRHRYIVGFHWCAYMENRTRCSGIKTYLDEPYSDCVERMQKFNCEQLYRTAAGR